MGREEILKNLEEKLSEANNNYSRALTAEASAKIELARLTEKQKDTEEIEM